MEGTMIDAIGRPQSVLVLGGSSEIARAIVAKVVPARAKTVVLAGREGARLDEAVAGAKAAGAEVVESVPFDATHVIGHQIFADQVFDRFGDIDLVIVAAGVLGDQATDELDPVAAASVLTTNFSGLAAAILAVTGRLRSQGHGRIVVLSSVAGERARKANFIYGSSKSGLDAFAQGLGDSLEGSGVGVTIVRPGFVVGRMTEGMTAWCGASRRAPRWSTPPPFSAGCSLSCATFPGPCGVACRAEGDGMTLFEP
jgi:decaprenylphospho-beta-D-erythro-pentofuranosid-2-ulose 2-reductase